MLVVGAGPTGLTIANELVRRGVSTRIVDRATHHTLETRALGVQARTLELLDRVGIAEAAVARGLPVSRFNVFSERRRIAYFDLGRLGTPFPFTLMLPQNELEELLERRLAGLGVRVQRGSQLVDLVEREGGLDVWLQNSDGSADEIYARWLVACDGAHSYVRNRLGLRFVGDSLEESFAVADVRVSWRLPYDELFAFLDRGEFTTFFPMRGGLHRVAIAYTGRETPAGEVTLDEVQRAIDSCGPGGVRVLEVNQTGRFRIHQRAVEHQSTGPVFLAGDAAHVSSVVGAQGMNIGMQDAFNLGWKLAHVCAGLAPEALLATYSRERERAVRRTVGGTGRFTRLTLWKSPLSAFARRRLAPLLLARRRVRATIEEALAEIDISYRGSGAATGSAGRPIAGDRAPEARLRAPDGGAVGLFERIAGDEYSLLLFGRPDRAPGRLADVRAAARTYAPLVREHLVLAADAAAGADREPTTLIDAEGEARRRYGVAGEAMVLVRPDGYIGLRLDAWNAARLAAHLSEWIRRRPQPERGVEQRP